MRKNIRPLSELTNTRLTMVGGVLEDGLTLSDNDAAYMRFTVATLTNLGIPLDDAFGQYLEWGNAVDSDYVDILNLNGQGHGGKRDFLKENLKTDVLVMANVAYRQSEGGDYLEGFSEDDFRLGAVFQLKNAMTVSPDNASEAKWRDKIRGSGARVIVVIGDDDFPPDKIAGDDYIILKGAISGIAGILLHRDYLQELRPHLKQMNAPLFSVAVSAQANPAYVDFIRAPDTLTFYPVRCEKRMAAMAEEAALAPSPWA